MHYRVKRVELLGAYANLEGACVAVADAIVLDADAEPVAQEHERLIESARDVLKGKGMGPFSGPDGTDYFIEEADGDDEPPPGQARVAILATVPERWDPCDIALWFERRLAELQRKQDRRDDDSALPILDDCNVFVALGDHVDEFSERVLKKRKEDLARGGGHE